MKHLLAWLPYVGKEPPEDRRPYARGSIEVIYDTKEQAYARRAALISDRAAEWIEVYEDAPGYFLGRKMIDRWNDVPNVPERDEEISEVAAHWNMLANAADDRARYEESRGSSGNAYRNQAETFRRTVVSLYLESETGVSHCVCCLKPSGVCR